MKHRQAPVERDGLTLMNLLRITGLAVALLGCDAQVAPQYLGEALVTLRGSVDVESDRKRGPLRPALAFSRLVRKGERVSRLAHGPELGAWVRSPLPNESRPCIGGSLAYAVDLESVGARLRLGACGGGFDNAAVHARVVALDSELRAYHAWDVSALTLQLGLGLGLSLFRQSFDAVGSAPPANDAVPFLSLAIGVTGDLGHGFALGLDLAAETHFLRIQDTDYADSELRPAFALRPLLHLVKRY